MPVLGSDLAGEFFIEEPRDRLDSFLLRDLRDIGGRLNAQMANAGLLKILQHDSVIAAEFDHERIGRRKIIAHHKFRELSKVFRHTRRSRREERISFIEHLLAVRLLCQLNHVALLAEPNLELEKVFCRKFGHPQKPVSNGHFAERHKGLVGGPADQALSHH